jgi:hypothetical protein
LCRTVFLLQEEVVQVIERTGCTHIWRIFKDSELFKSGCLTFFCTKCLELRKVRKEYKEVR